jgi:hypothetical protein
MTVGTDGFIHLENSLNENDLNFLKQTCKDYIIREGIPCYVFIDKLTAPTFIKIKKLVENALNAKMLYLNDFYMYTDEKFRAGWHMDTELFTIDNAYNVWILLSPSEINSPLVIMKDFNSTPERFFHSVKITDDECLFSNFYSGEQESASLSTIEAEKIQAPKIKMGDLLCFSPKRFHKTNVNEPKHAFIIKFVKAPEVGKSFLSDTPVPSIFWPETEIITKLVGDTADWDVVINRLRAQLKNDVERSALSAGFYPEKFPLYKQMVQTLI